MAPYIGSLGIDVAWIIGVLVLLVVIAVGVWLWRLVSEDWRGT